MQREQLFRTEDEWIIQFEIINHEGRDTTYTVNILMDGKQYGDRFTVQDGCNYTYAHHISRKTVATGEVNSIVYKEGEITPLEQVNYSLN